MPDRSALSTPRGVLPRILAQAGEIAEAQQRLTLKLLDEMTDSTHQRTLGKGRRLSRADYLTLLRDDPAMQERVLAKLPFATKEERAKLKRDLEALLPPPMPPGMAPAGMGMDPTMMHATIMPMAPAPMAPPGADGSLPFSAPAPLALPAPGPGEGF